MLFLLLFVSNRAVTPHTSSGGSESLQCLHSEPAVLEHWESGGFDSCCPREFLRKYNMPPEFLTSLNSYYFPLEPAGCDGFLPLKEQFQQAIGISLHIPFKAAVAKMKLYSGFYFSNSEQYTLGKLSFAKKKTRTTTKQCSEGNVVICGNVIVCFTGCHLVFLLMCCTFLFLNHFQ